MPRSLVPLPAVGALGGGDIGAAAGTITGGVAEALIATACGLLVFWSLVRMAADLDEELYRGGIIGLIAATAAHLVGTLAGAVMAPAKGAPAAYLASTLVRFVLTPALAVSLYFLLPVKPQPFLVGAATGYLLILLADIATMLKAMQQHSGSPSA